ncbi:DEAD/DEAH box helicase [Kitasatospora viridis]|uniref:SNF2 family DNA or RNA helicase n=1 Tax=Kitasatospora viridis TaxID=281105 RepID=A0A561UIK5_9ACTN|nr:DEAD/DEAH box helicase [Kitasatospora viridis]TWF99208.1 SNF2 family DNA or RNA helicase [Kitasatospora viridis]
MFAVHARWRPEDGSLALWAEDGRAVGQPSNGGPGHPFACSAELLGRLLGGIGPGLEWLAGRAAERWTTLALPSAGAVPVPSPELPGLGLGRGAAGALREWRVPTLRFEAAEAAQLLGELADPRWALASSEMPEVGRVDVAYGASLRWLTAVHDLAFRLAGRGRVLPALDRTADGARARWQPALAPVDRHEVRALADNCPPAVRGPHEPTALLTAALAALTDCEVRAALAERPPRLPGALRDAPSDRPDAQLTDRWFAALLAPDGRLPLAGLPEPAAALDRLADRLAAWHGSAAPGTAVRLCFRLVEPLGTDPLDPDAQVPDEAWRIDFLVEAVAEPSLRVPAADLWFTGGPASAAFERVVADPRAEYLAELHRAARCRPELAPALAGARPGGLRLDRDGALAFLREAAPALLRAGFGVLLPTWWQRRPRLDLALGIRPATPSAVAREERLDHDALVAFRWRLALDGDPLTAEELADLAAAKRGLVRIRGQWIEADPARIAAALAFLDREGGGEQPVTRLLRTVLDPGALVAGLPVGAVRATEVLGALLDPAACPDEPAVRLPAGFGTTLRPYQERGVAWLHALGRLGLGAVLADDMGLGKTVQTLALLAQEHAEGRPGPVLLVCPMSLLANWRREAARFAPMLRVHVQHGPGRPAGEALADAVAGADLVLTSYGVLTRDAPQLRRIGWRRIVADEAQTVKNGSTGQARALRSLRAGHRIALTGTPVENRLSELHAVLDFANPGLLGSAAAFRERYAVPVEQHRSAERLAELRRRTAPFVLRRRKGDPGVLAELPAKQESTVRCLLTTEQAGLYQAVVADLLHRLRSGLKGVERKGAVLGAIGRLKQVCNHPAQLLHDGSAVAGRSGKVARLEELLENTLAAGERTLVFTQYAEFGALLRPHLAERLDTEVLYLHGRLGARRRTELVDRFQQADGPGVFLLSLKAGGTGLNLTAASQVVHLDRWWNPATEDQATDRAHRIGQHRTVQVRRFVCAGTVEERIAELMDAKRELAEAVVAGGERRLTELSLDELHELLTLSQEALTA